jgi:hypothetical protein
MRFLEYLLWPLTLIVSLIFSTLTSYSPAPQLNNPNKSFNQSSTRRSQQQRDRQIMERNDPGSYGRMLARNAELRRLDAYDRAISQGTRNKLGQRVKQVYRLPNAQQPNLDFFGNAQATPL